MSDYYEHLEAAWNDLSKEDKEKFISSNIRQQQPIIKEDGEDELWEEMENELANWDGDDDASLQDFINKQKSKFHITRKTPN